jgi:hypothetical protein
MIEVITPYGVARFDGAVLELFEDQGRTSRFHIRFIEKLEFQPGKKGFMVMDVRYGKGGRSGFGGWAVPEEHVEATQQLADAVRQAIEQASGQW